MEFLVACRWHPFGSHRRHCFPVLVFYQSQRLGNGRSDTLSLRHAHVVHCFYCVSCSLGMEQVERATAQMGSCCHLLAYCRFILSHHAYSYARSGLLGLESVLFHLGLRHCRNCYEFLPAEGSQQFGNHLFRWHGTFCVGCFQASY